MHAKPIYQLTSSSVVVLWRGDVNTIFALKFDNETSVEWVKTAAITLVLSIGVMAFVKVIMVWALPRAFLGFGIIMLSVGFVVVAGICQAAVKGLGGEETGGCT